MNLTMTTHLLDYTYFMYAHCAYIIFLKIPKMPQTDDDLSLRSRNVGKPIDKDRFYNEMTAN